MARILVVARPLEIRSTLALVLELGGHSCEIAASFREAARLLREDNFDLLLVHSQREVSFRAFARRIKVALPQTSVVFLSETKAGRVEGEGSEIVTGPLPPQDLLDLVQSVLRKRPRKIQGNLAAREKIRA